MDSVSLHTCPSGGGLCRAASSPSRPPSPSAEPDLRRLFLSGQHLPATPGVQALSEWGPCPASCSVARCCPPCGPGRAAAALLGARSLGPSPPGQSVGGHSRSRLPWPDLARGEQGQEADVYAVLPRRLRSGLKRATHGAVGPLPARPLGRRACSGQRALQAPAWPARPPPQGAGEGPGLPRAGGFGLRVHSLPSSQAVLCSCYIPYVSGILPPSFRGVVSLRLPVAGSGALAPHTQSHPSAAQPPDRGGRSCPAPRPRPPKRLVHRESLICLSVS